MVQLNRQLILSSSKQTTFNSYFNRTTLYLIFLLFQEMLFASKWTSTNFSMFSISQYWTGLLEMSWSLFQILRILFSLIVRVVSFHADHSYTSVSKKENYSNIDRIIIISISRNGLLKLCARFIIERSEIRKKQHDFECVHFECRMHHFFTRYGRKVD